MLTYFFFIKNANILCFNIIKLLVIIYEVNCLKNQSISFSRDYRFRAFFIGNVCFSPQCAIEYVSPEGSFLCSC